MLIEALIAILIFSIGILGIVGLQASAVQQSTDAKNRAEAAHLVDQLIGQMWASDRKVTTLQSSFNSCGSCTAYNAWLTTVNTVLPGASAKAPTVDVSDTGVVTISIFWTLPSNDTGAYHRYDVSAQIGQ
jgi:type IV pilus assembly protein PilV